MAHVYFLSCVGVLLRMVVWEGYVQKMSLNKAIAWNAIMTAIGNGLGLRRITNE